MRIRAAQHLRRYSKQELSVERLQHERIVCIEAAERRGKYDFYTYCVRFFLFIMHNTIVNPSTYTRYGSQICKIPCPLAASRDAPIIYLLILRCVLAPAGDRTIIERIYYVY
jgi:hypothetical protein